MVLLGASACNAFRERPTSQVGIAIAYGQSIVEEGITITFRDVLDDTRCPPAEICTIPGNVRLEFRVQYTDGLEKTIWIDTGFGTPHQLLSETVLLRVTDVQPPRDPNHQFAKSDYVVSVELVPV